VALAGQPSNWQRSNSSFPNLAAPVRSSCGKAGLCAVWRQRLCQHRADGGPLPDTDDHAAQQLSRRLTPVRRGVQKHARPRHSCRHVPTRAVLRSDAQAAIERSPRHRHVDRHQLWTWDGGPQGRSALFGQQDRAIAFDPAHSRARTTVLKAFACALASDGADQQGRKGRKQLANIEKRSAGSSW